MPSLLTFPMLEIFSFSLINGKEQLKRAEITKDTADGENSLFPG